MFELFATHSIFTDTELIYFVSYLPWRQVELHITSCELQDNNMVRECVELRGNTALEINSSSLYVRVVTN